ncbi:MAG: hypothetical protein NT085_00685 [candidate division SR1 bacterium]|nr:hypothetical protein [candidate division SR1 bacterium]
MKKLLLALTILPISYLGSIVFGAVAPLNGSIPVNTTALNAGNVTTYWQTCIDQTNSNDNVQRALYVGQNIAPRFGYTYSNTNAIRARAVMDATEMLIYNPGTFSTNGQFSFLSNINPNLNAPNPFSIVITQPNNSVVAVNNAVGRSAVAGMYILHGTYQTFTFGGNTSANIYGYRTSYNQNPATYFNKNLSDGATPAERFSCARYFVAKCGDGIQDNANKTCAGGAPDCDGKSGISAYGSIVPWSSTSPNEACDGTDGVPAGYTCTSSCTLQAIVVKPTCTLSVNTGSIIIGDSVQTSWTINGNYTNTPQITYTPTTWNITGLPHTVSTSMGQHTITPTHTGGYTLSMTVSNSAGANTCTAPLLVKPQPQHLSCTLSINPNPVLANQFVSIGWNITGGTFQTTYIMVFPQGVRVGGAWPHQVLTNTYNGVSTVQPIQTGDYTFSMSVQGMPRGGSTMETVVCTGILHVIPNIPPTCSLTPTTVNITSGQTTTLNASYTNATLADLNPTIAGVNFTYPNRNTTNLSVHPTTTTTYTLVVTGAAGTSPAICQSTVNVTEIPIPTCSLTTTTPTIQPGQTAILNASYTNAILATMTPNITGLNFIFPNRSNSSIAVTPTTTTTYTLNTLGISGSGALCTTTINVINTSLTLNKTLISNILYHSGDLVSFKIDFTNNGLSTANGVILSDYLPAGLEYVSSQIYGVAPYTSAVGINGINQFVEYSGFSLTPGQAGYLIVVGRFKGYAYSNQTLNNAFLKSDTTPMLYAAALFNVYTPTGNALVVKTSDKQSYYPGEDTKFTIAVTNNGPDAIDHVTITDDRPNTPYLLADSQWTSNVPLTMTNSTDPYVWTYNGSLAVGQTIYVYLTGHISNTPSSVGTYINTTLLSYMVNGQIKTGQANATINVAIVPASTMIFEKRLIQYGNNVGDGVTFELLYQNNGTATITNYDIVDYWPGTLNFVSASPMPITQTPTSGGVLLHWIFTTPIAPNGSGKITLNGTIH